jgi:hypothetical protein
MAVFKEREKEPFEPAFHPLSETSLMLVRPEVPKPEITLVTPILNVAPVEPRLLDGALRRKSEADQKKIIGDMRVDRRFDEITQKAWEDTLQAFAHFSREFIVAIGRIECREDVRLRVSHNFLG